MRLGFFTESYFMTVRPVRHEFRHDTLSPVSTTLFTACVLHTLHTLPSTDPFGTDESPTPSKVAASVLLSPSTGRKIRARPLCSPPHSPDDRTSKSPSLRFASTPKASLASFSRSAISTLSSASELLGFVRGAMRTCRSQGYSRRTGNLYKSELMESLDRVGIADDSMPGGRVNPFS